MTDPSRIRKPVTALSATDLETYPVWEYAVDEESSAGQDETWVRPCQGASVARRRYSQLAATEFHTPTGLRLLGFMSVTTAAGRPELEPGALLLASGYYPLPSASRAEGERLGYPWIVQEHDAIASGLTLPESEVFPLSYRILVPIEGVRGLLSGVLP